MRDIWMNRGNTKNNSTSDMINNVKESRGKVKLKFYKIISNYYNEMKKRNFQTQEDPFSKNAQGLNNIYPEVWLLMKFLKTKPQVKNLNNIYYDLHFTVI